MCNTKEKKRGTRDSKQNKTKNWRRQNKAIESCCNVKVVVLKLQRLIASMCICLINGEVSLQVCFFLLKILFMKAFIMKFFGWLFLLKIRKDAFYYLSWLLMVKSFIRAIWFWVFSVCLFRLCDAARCRTAKLWRLGNPHSAIFLAKQVGKSYFLGHGLVPYNGDQKGVVWLFLKICGPHNSFPNITCNNSTTFFSWAKHTLGVQKKLRNFEILCV